ncbi:hypothetical protein CB1_001026025 [Camelus ferus]|nr:hypothetical protein CB1_001026025 [Camelus ferus]
MDSLFVEEVAASLVREFLSRKDNLDGDVLGNFASSKRPSHRSKPVQTVPAESPPVAPAWEKMDKLQLSEPSLDTKRMGEKIRPKSGLIVRGMMAGPIASSSQDSLHKRSMKRSPAFSSRAQAQEEGSPPVPELSAHTPPCPAPQEGRAAGTGSTPRSPLDPLSQLTSEKRRTSPSSPPHLPGKGLPQRGRGRGRDLLEDSPAVDCGPEADRTALKFSFFGGSARTSQESPERAFKRQGSQPPALRPKSMARRLGGCSMQRMLLLLLLDGKRPLKLRDNFGELALGSAAFADVSGWRSQLPVSNKVDNEPGVLQLEDVEDELVREEVILSPVPSMLKLQVVSKPIDLSVAKGGPCGVLAAVQGCVLQKLLFEGDSRADCARQLQPSNAHRTHCLALAIADIVWRAGGHERAVITLLTCFEELVTFLQQSVHQFEAGPYGCVLLTLSAILSRSTELIRQDFDVPTNHLIGAHGYCTQELVNLLLTGKAVSNVFNNVVELDSGDGNITLLKGIATRSDIGFLSLFEHYNVCQVGCFLKTPKFPIWVVCSESHFSVLFSLQLELLSDWKTERLFDLYYYDGLANQQEQIRLTIDTSQTIPEDRDSDLVPPLELCIRTKEAEAQASDGLPRLQDLLPAPVAMCHDMTRWKGALVNWNGSDPIL